MNEILHAPEFQQLESAWRGLHLSRLQLRDRRDAQDPRDERRQDRALPQPQEHYPGARWDQSPLFKTSTRASSGTLGGEPYGALVADYHFSHSPADVQLLRDLSKIASASLAPLVTGADPNLLGMDSWRDLMNPRDIGKLMDTPDYAAWKGLRDFGRQPLRRAVHAARAVAPALWREVGAGRGIRLRGGHRRPQGREIRLDERGLRDGARTSIAPSRNTAGRCAFAASNPAAR